MSLSFIECVSRACKSSMMMTWHRVVHCCRALVTTEYLCGVVLWPHNLSISLGSKNRHEHYWSYTMSTGRKNALIVVGAPWSTVPSGLILMLVLFFREFDRLTISDRSRFTLCPNGLQRLLREAVYVSSAPCRRAQDAKWDNIRVGSGTARMRRTKSRGMFIFPSEYGECS